MEYELTLTASMEFLGIEIPNHNEFDRQLVLKFKYDPLLTLPKLACLAFLGVEDLGATILTNVSRRAFIGPQRHF